MHDIHRDSLIHKKKTRKKKEQHDHGGHNHSHNDHNHDDHMHSYDATTEEGHGHSHYHGELLHEHNHAHKVHGVDGLVHDHGDGAHSHDKDHGHDHDDHSHGQREHSHDNHDVPHGHSHEHDEEEYHKHDHDLHIHKHHDHDAVGGRDFGNRAFAHLHEHEHTFAHRHHHDHHPEHVGIIHKIFKDPVRDWFAAGLMLFLIYAGYNRLLPGHLSNGVLVCAAIIGIFPVIKNALIECITRKKPSIELVIGMVFLIGLFSGRFLEVAVAALLMLVGSFMRVNFSWWKE